MSVVLVLAHPVEGSYCHQLAHRAHAGLRAGGHDVALLDLHAAEFRAAMTNEERMAYHGDQPIRDPMVAEHARLLELADTMVFVYPTWWSGLPAILKGWLERVMVPGVAFRFDERTGKVRPALTNIRHVVGVSTYEPSRARMAVTNDNGRRVLTRALRINCGLDTRTRWFGIYDIENSTVIERDEFAARVEREVADLR